MFNSSTYSSNKNSKINGQPLKWGQQQFHAFSLGPKFNGARIETSKSGSASAKVKTFHKINQTTRSAVLFL